MNGVGEGGGSQTKWTSRQTQAGTGHSAPSHRGGHTVHVDVYVCVYAPGRLRVQRDRETCTCNSWSVLRQIMLTVDMLISATRAAPKEHDARVHTGIGLVEVGISYVCMALALPLWEA